MVVTPSVEAHPESDRDAVVKRDGRRRGRVFLEILSHMVNQLIYALRALSGRQDCFIRPSISVRAQLFEKKPIFIAGDAENIDYHTLYRQASRGIKHMCGHITERGRRGRGE